MTGVEEQVAYVTLDAAAELAQIEALFGHAGPAFEDAALARAAAARHLPYTAYREMAASGRYFSSPRHAWQTLVGLGLERALA